MMNQPLPLVPFGASSPSALPAPLVPGSDLSGRYRLQRKLGEGGMGSVWMATNLALDTPVAIKLIRPRARIPRATERLLGEARATAQLCHPAIVRVFDFGITLEGQAYLVMEALEGESLRDLLQREGALSPDRAVRILLPIVEGLAAAHARGIVHRDLKPENIFLALDDSGRIQPKIVDFGIATTPSSTAEPGLLGRAAAGTPEYMAPEQALSHPGVDHRADVWAVCAVLHELCTDAYVFSGATSEDTLRAVVYSPTPPLLDVAGVDEALWNIIERGLRKQKEERWDSAASLGRALADWLLARGIDDDASGTSVRSSWLSPARAPFLDAGPSNETRACQLVSPPPRRVSCAPGASGEPTPEAATAPRPLSTPLARTQPLRGESSGVVRVRARSSGEATRRPAHRGKGLGVACALTVSLLIASGLTYQRHEHARRMREAAACEAAPPSEGSAPTPTAEPAPSPSQAPLTTTVSRTSAQEPPQERGEDAARPRVQQARRTRAPAPPPRASHGRLTR